MKTALFPKWRANTKVEETRLEAGEITVHVMPGTDQLTVTVTGRITVDSSPDLHSALLELLRRVAAPLMIIDLSAVSYLVSVAKWVILAIV